DSTTTAKLDSSVDTVNIKVSSRYGFPAVLTQSRRLLARLAVPQAQMHQPPSLVLILHRPRWDLEVAPKPQVQLQTLSGLRLQFCRTSEVYRQSALLCYDLKI